MVYTDRHEQFPAEPDYSVTLRDERRFRESLRRYGLVEEAVELLYSRFVENLSYREIHIEQGWTKADAARHYANRMLTDLRNMGFKPKKDDEE